METQIPLIALNDGRKFSIPGLSNYRNLRLIRSNDCSAVISGDRKLKINDKDVWSVIPSGYAISPYTVVEPI